MHEETQIGYLLAVVNGVNNRIPAGAQPCTLAVFFAELGAGVTV
jgi:hypothetical protein